ncbi:MAG: choice-of-anchor J domain-containing protein, partial [Gammaproteobacteria bacterium]|nr:choice-of-anchor J domain-containing protein [Gammaproteobacteria bacterium]
MPAGTSTWDYYTVDLGFTAADTGYIGITYNGASYYYVIDDVVIPPDVPEPVAGLPEGYSLESFESSVPPAEWTLINDGDANGWVQSSASANTGSYSARITYSSSAAHDDWLITPQMSIEAGDSITLYAKNGSASWTEQFNVMVSTASTDKADFTATLASTVEPPTTWTNYSYDLSAYAGSDIYVGIQAITWDALYLYIDDVLIPWVLPPTAELSHSAALDFHTVAVDTAAGTGSQALSTDIINTGQDTLRGSIASGSAVFTISSDTVDLAPGDTLALTVTYAPTAVGDDSSGITFYTNSGGAADTSAISVEGSAIEA